MVNDRNHINILHTFEDIKQPEKYFFYNGR